MSFTSPMISVAICSSKLPVGSSASSRPGDLTIARARDARCASPCESWWGNACARADRPTAFKAAKALGVMSRRATPSTRSTKATFSKTLRPARSLESWNTTPIERRSRGTSDRRSAVTSNPATSMSPSEGVSAR